jgi:hypothetical protein
MPRGGKQPGAGRKSIAEELGTRDLARKAIIARWGSLEEGLQALLSMNEQALTKFVFEHAMGKPVEDHNVNQKSELTITYDGGIGDLIDPAT